MAKRRLKRRRVGRRSVAVALVLLVAVLYWRPVSSYFSTRGALDRRRAEVHVLRAEKAALEQRLAASTSEAALAREARSLGYIRPGQHLYIVKGIDGWLRAHRGTLVRSGR